MSGGHATEGADPAAHAAASARVAASFARQGLMATLGARLGEVGPGRVVIALPVAPGVAQQGGSVHAGAVAAIADSACGYAALTLMPAGADVVTAEFKLNLLRPALGDHLEAAATVLRPGRRLTVAEARVTAHAHGEAPRLVAVMLATLVPVEG